MTPKFLRDEAARFRGMAGDTDRAATKERFLAMAADYDARAASAAEPTDPDPIEAESESVEVTPEEVPRVTLGGKIATGLKETVLVQRRPVGRPRRE
jgi:D-alanyl-D-alanine carboxypeptidase